MPTLPDAYRAAARLGCQETFALVSDERAPSVRRVWLAEQTELSRYELREQLGEDWTGRETTDKFALLYMAAAKHNVNWFVIKQGTPDMPVEIRDEYGQIICKKILRMRDAYSKGPVLSEAQFVSKREGDVVWAEVWDGSGKMIAEAPAKITERDEDDEGIVALMSGDDDAANKKLLAQHAQGLAAGLQSMGAAAAAAQGVASAITNTSSVELQFRWEGDPQAPTGSACVNDEGTVKLYMAIDCRDDEDDDEQDDGEDTEDEDSDA